MRIIGTMRAVDDTRGAVRVEDVYDTGIDDLWEACTTPARLARWIAEVSGDPHEGGTVHAVFTSSWSGPARIEVCDAPHHLLLTTEPGTEDECQIVAWLSPEGARTRLVVESGDCRSGRSTSMEPVGRPTSRTSHDPCRATGHHTSTAGPNRCQPPAGTSAGPSSPLRTRAHRSADL